MARPTDSTSSLTSDRSLIPEEVTQLAPSDYRKAAEFIWDEYSRRQAQRQDLEATWAEVDRQVAMKYEIPQIDLESGRAKAGTAWMPRLELPWQAETLEILTTDLDRMAFPGVGNHFEVDADASPDVLAAIEVGIQLQEPGIPGNATQDLVNELVTAVHERYQRVYGYRGQWRRMFADAFKYGTMVGRQRVIPASVVGWDGEALTQDLPAPVLSAISPQNCYLDTTAYGSQRQGWYVAPGHIYQFSQRLADLRLAAKHFPSDPNDIQGGWLPSQLDGLEASNLNGDIDVLEWEGDFVFEPSAGQSIYVPNVIITVVKGGGSRSRGGSTQWFSGGGDQRVIRIRSPKSPFHSYIVQPYFVDRDDACSVYGTSPLMKGRPIQKAGSVTINRWMAVAILNAEPPIKWDPSDTALAQSGGPSIEPRALWPTLGEVEPVQIGDLAALAASFAQLRAEYQDVTGTSAPRLGQQTKSHQTAFAVDSELIRGLSRTVSFGQWVTSELMPRQLQMEYFLIRQYLPKKGLRVMLPKTRAWITVTRNMLPEMVRYTVSGAADPMLEREKQQRKLVALQQVAAVDQAAQAAGFPSLNWDAMRREILTEGGFTDVDRILQSVDPMAIAAAAAGGLGGVPGGAPGGPPAGPAAGGVPTAVPLRLAAGQAGPA